MQASTGQYSTHAGEPAQPVQLSNITARILGFFLRKSGRPCDMGSSFSNVPANSEASVIASPGSFDFVILELFELGRIYQKTSEQTKETSGLAVFLDRFSMKRQHLCG